MIVRQPRLQRLLLGIRDQEPILISRTSTSQQTDKSDEPDTAEDYQSLIGGSKRHMARRIALCLVGIQNYGKNPNRRNSFQGHL